MIKSIRPIIDWVFKNKDWLFSGVGLFLASTTIGFLFNSCAYENSNDPKKSTNIYNPLGGHINVINGGKDITIEQNIDKLDSTNSTDIVSITNNPSANKKKSLYVSRNLIIIVPSH